MGEGEGVQVQVRFSWSWRNLGTFEVDRADRLGARQRRVRLVVWPVVREALALEGVPSPTRHWAPGAADPSDAALSASGGPRW